MKTDLFRRAVLAGLAVVGVGSAVQADVVATFTGNSPFQTVATTNAGTTYNDLPAGPFNFTVSNAGGTALGSSFSGFCADYFQPVAAGETYNYTPVAISSLPDIGSDATKLARIQELFDRFYSTITGDSAKSAAFQLSIWELTYDGADTLDLSGGSFTATGGSSVGIAQGWMDTINDPNAAAPADKYTLIGLLSSTNPDQIVGIPEVNPIPAPAGVVLAAIGGGILLARRRFAAKKTESAVQV
jgi:hypothetical protein